MRTCGRSAHGCRRGAVAMWGAAVWAGMFCDVGATQTAVPAGGGDQSDRSIAGSEAAADADAGSTLAEVGVTARKREERLIDVPVAVTELSPDRVDTYAATDLTQIGNLVPGVSLDRTAGGASGAALTIRGVGNLGQDYNTEQPVAINVDGVQLTRGHIADVGFFDLQSVQVLKGPQALYFGKNSPAGVVSLDSETPGNTLEGYTRAYYEFVTQTPAVEGAVSIPLNDTLSVRLAGRFTDMLGGYITNDARPLADPFPTETGFILPGAAHRELPGMRESLGRITVAWKPDADFSATLKLLIADYHDDGGASGQEMIACAPGNSHPTTLNLLDPAQAFQDPYGGCSANNHVSLGIAPAQILSHFVGGPSNGVPFSQTRTYLTSLTLNYQLPLMTLTSITGYYDEWEGAFDNYDQTVYAQALDAQRDQDRQISQEIRAVSRFEGPLNVTAGAFYSNDEHHDGDTDKIFPLGPYPGSGPYSGAYNTLAMAARNSAESASVFAELNWQIQSNLELAGGARYSYNHTSTAIGNVFNYFDYLVGLGAIAAAANPFSPAAVVYHVPLSETNVSPEATLTYHPAKDLTLYGAYKTGYLAGGSANPANVGNYVGLADPSEPLRFDKETVSGGEIGAKGLFFDGRLQADLTFYRYTYTGLQVQTFDPNTTSYTVHNAGRSLNQGIELQSSYRVARGLDVHGSLELVELEFLRYDDAQCYPGQTAAQGCHDIGLPNSFQDLSGTRYGGSPVSVNIGSSYERPLSGAIGLRVSADVFFNARSPSYERDPLAVTPAYTLVNLSVALYQPNGPLTVALIGTNLGNDIYYKNFLFKPLGANNDIVAESVGLPRQVALQGSYRF